LDNLAVLDVEATDLGKGAARGSGIGDELGDNRELLGGVNGEALAVEGGVAHTVRVEITAVGIADAGIAVGGTASVAFAARLGTRRARMRSVGGGDAICLPDVHLVTARSILP